MNIHFTLLRNHSLIAFLHPVGCGPVLYKLLTRDGYEANERFCAHRCNLAANGISLDANSLQPNGGTLKDAAGNLAVLTHPGLADDADYLVDTTAPSLNSVVLSDATGAVNNTLNAGDVVNATVTLSEATTVTGMPTLGMHIGNNVLQAHYVSGSSTHALVFSYTRLAGQADANGIGIDANSLALVGGAL